MRSGKMTAQAGPMTNAHFDGPRPGEKLPSDEHTRALLRFEEVGRSLLRLREGKPQIAVELYK